MTGLIHGYSATSAHVNDLDKARAFYAKVLGFKEASHDAAMGVASYEVPGSDAPFTIHRWSGPCEAAGGRPPGTVSGIVFHVKDTAATVAEIKKRGGRITDEPDKRPWGAVVATVADPDGNEFVLSDM